MSKKLCLCVSSFLLSWSDPTAAETFETYWQQAQRDSVLLQGKAEGIRVAEQVEVQSGYLPEPNISVAMSMLPVQTKVGPQVGKVSIQQNLPWMGVRGAQRDLAQSGVEQAEMAFALSQRSYRQSLQKLWYPMLELSEKIKVLEQHQTLLQSVAQMSQRRLESGTGNLVDVLRVEMKQSNVAVELELAQAQLATWKRQFNVACSAPIEREIVLDGDGNEDQFKAMQPQSPAVQEDHPSLLLLSLQQQAMVHQRKLAGLSKYPSLNVGVDWVLIGQGDSSMSLGDLKAGQDALMPMVGVRVPLYRQKYVAAEKEAEHRRQALYYQQSTVQQELQVQLEQSLFAIEASQRQAALYQSQIQKIQQSIHLLLSSYRASNADFESLLQLEQTLLQYQIQLLSVEKEQNLAWVNYEYLTGGEQ